jgi:hypothetical protein
MVAEAGEIISGPAKAAIRNAHFIFSPLIHGMPAAQLATVQVFGCQISACAAIPRLLQIW